MKIRIVTDKIRFRLRKSDFKKLAEKQIIEESLSFPKGDDLFYKIKIGTTKEIQIEFSNNTISLALPKFLFEKWMQTDQVGIDTSILLSNARRLFILLEKDFPCKHTEDNKEDTFYELVPDDEVC